jgi:hypothetical protein
MLPENVPDITADPRAPTSSSSPTGCPSSESAPRTWRREPSADSVGDG